MNEDQAQKLLKMLEEIRDTQRLQMERQAESLKIQQQQFEMAARQFERAERINARAEQIQEKSAQMVGGARKVLAVVLPVIILLVIYLSWLLFSRF